MAESTAFATLFNELSKQEIPVERSVPLSTLTSFRVGGPCELLVRPRTLAQVKASICCATEANILWCVVGNGSNLLASDAGYRGMVLHTAELNDLECDGDCVIASAGVSLTKLCNFAQANALTGLEFAYGIPASVGGALYMNAGAYGGEIKDVIREIQFLDSSGGCRTVSTLEAAFSYRKSSFMDWNGIVLGGTFSLTPGNPDAIRATMETIIARRREKQPLEYPSAGSTFKRPAGHYAAALIEQCGLKGKRVGGAQVSEKHSGFIINAGNATCDDILRLIAEVKRAVLEQTGVVLECEVKQIGF